MLTYEQKKDLVLEIDQICQKQGKEHDKSVEMKNIYKKKGMTDEWRDWHRWSAADLSRWSAYNEMLTLVVRRLFDYPEEEDAYDFVCKLRKEKT